MVVVDPTAWPRFFVGAVVGSAGWPCFVNALVGLAIYRAMGLASRRGILKRADVAIGFSELSLW